MQRQPPPSIERLSFRLRLRSRIQRNIEQPIRRLGELFPCNQRLLHENGLNLAFRCGRVCIRNLFRFHFHRFFIVLLRMDADLGFSCFFWTEVTSVLGAEEFGEIDGCSP